MKNISLILNVILTVAVVILFVLHFSGSDSTVEDQPEVQEGSGSFTIAYIHADSLLNNYQYVLDENEKLRQRTQEIERDYKSRAEGLQKELVDYQQNYSNLTIGQARAIEESLQQKEQNLMMFQERARQELLEIEADISRKLYSTVTEYLEQYSEENGIQMVVKFDTSSDVLYAGRGLDITEKVIDHLNTQYMEPETAVSASDTTSQK